jgi:excisionase family DNA binding protein
MKKTNARRKTNMEPLLLNTMEAAARLRVGRSTMQQLIRDKQIKAFKIGRVLRVPLSSIDAYIAKQLKHSLIGNRDA